MNESIEKLFNLVVSDYDTLGPSYFTYFGKKLVEASSLGGDMSILDLACGRGASLILTSKQCKEIHGMDLSNGMLEVFTVCFRVVIAILS